MQGLDFCLMGSAGLRLSSFSSSTSTLNAIRAVADTQQKAVFGEYKQYTRQTQSKEFPDWSTHRMLLRVLIICKSSITL